MTIVMSFSPVSFVYVFLIWTTVRVHGFAPPARSAVTTTSSPLSIIMASLAPPLVETAAIIDEHSYVLSPEEVHPLFTFGKGETKKIVNGFGLRALLATLITGPIWMMAMTIVQWILDNSNEKLDPHRASFDRTGKIWAHTWLKLTDSTPTYSGELQLLRSSKEERSEEPYLYVANHASWLDIPLLCTVLDPVFKFIAKGELKNVPCIGQQLSGGHHILIDREDRRSQLRTFKESVAWLQKGVSLMAFPEGMRSKDGRLMEFKGGIFSMALRAGVSIVPISLSHTHAIMPPNALFPVQSGRNKLHVHVHPAIGVQGKTEAELAQMVRESLLSALPRYQHPVEEDAAAAAAAVERVAV